MKIQILRNTVAGGLAVRAGQMVEASDADARYLLATGKATAAVAEPALEPLEAPKRKPRTKVTSDGNLSTDT